MAKKMPALQGPLKSWVGSGSWRFYLWGDESRQTHPRAIAVKLTPRGAEAREAGVLLRNHSFQLGAWYILPAEKIHKLRPVWVAGFRRCPTRYEVDNECLLEADQVQAHLDG
jgi:hypothetical protein